ncbi:MAG: hypothetical protein M3419_00060 [Actinomycetota bacterium]|nr:hypothetical protein [Actinomycetota bacterium]
MSRVISVEAFPVEVPVTKTFTFASGTAGAAGSSVTVPFVKVTDSDGQVGWGEGRPSPSWNYETADSVLSTIGDYLAPAVLGLQPSDRWGLHARMRAAIGLGPSTGMPVAKAALDIALHDLAARAAGLTLRAFLGGADARSEVELSYTVTSHDAAAAREEVASARDAGFRHMNFKVGVEPGTDVAVARAIREQVGPAAFVWADANQSLALHEARLLCERLRDVGTDVLEQPLRADTPHLMSSLRTSTLLPLATDESTVSPADFLRLAAGGSVDYLVVKVTRSGGLWPTWQQIAVADAAGLQLLVSGLTDCMLTKAAACAAAAAVGYRGPAALNGSQFLDDSEFFPTKTEMEHGGVVRLGSGPGLGIAPDEAGVRRRANGSLLVQAD